MSRTYTKATLTIPQQISRLQAEGMTIADVARAEYWLRHVSYYRLSAYWLYFEHPKGTPGPRFRPGTGFDTVTALYDFDRNLRRIVMRGCEHVEVALRGSWAHQMAMLGDGHSFLNASHYSKREEFYKSLGKLSSEIGWSRETYVKHYRDNYDTPAIPPVWMVAEMMSFGQLSRWYSNLAERALRTSIAKPLGLPETVMVSIVRHITDIRNICAHHGRLWNRGFLIAPKLADKPKDLRATLDRTPTHPPARLYNALVTIGYIIRCVAPASTWLSDVKTLIGTHPVGDTAAMGFPADWEQRPMWQI